MPSTVTWLSTFPRSETVMLRVALLAIETSGFSARLEVDQAGSTPQ